MLFFIVLWRIYIFVLRFFLYMPGIFMRTTDECLFKRALIKVPIYTLYLMSAPCKPNMGVGAPQLCRGVAKPLALGWGKVVDSWGT